MKESAIIVLPLPARVLSPNCPVASMRGRYAKAAASKRYRKLAREETKQLCIAKPWNLCTVTAFFYHKTKRRRDDVNHLAMLKPAYDGCVEGGLIVDDSAEHLKTQTPEFHIDKKNPRVELVFKRLD